MATLVGVPAATADDLRSALASSGAALDDLPYRIVWVADTVRIGSLNEGVTPVRTLALTPPAIPPTLCWELLANGADEVIAWHGAGSAPHVVARLHRWSAVDQLIASDAVRREVIGDSPALRRALGEVLELAAFGTSPILLTGETGTGKELVARLAHCVSPGAAGPFVVLDCTTIVPSLSGSELFGHERGAFTGAERARGGAIAAADGGTLFLDEIGELSLELQVQLLRVLQEHAYKRIGGDVWSRSEFRLISATNRDLAKEQRRGRFRSDLYHRIASGVVHLPPLRERPEDLEPLLSHFLREALGREVAVAAEVLQMLRDRDYPGNLRELQQLAGAIAARHTGPGPITAGEVPPRHRPAHPGAQHDQVEPMRRAVRRSLRAGISLNDLRRLVGELAVEIALAECQGNVQRAAAMLRVSDRAVQVRKRGRERGDASG